MIEPLVLVPRLFPHEFFPSWVARIAAANESPLTWAIEALGLSATHSGMPRAYGIWMSQAQLTVASQMTQVSNQRIRRSLISAWEGGPVERTGKTADPIATDTRRFARQNSWLYLNGSHHCPRCLADQHGAWSLYWKLPWSFACLKHGQLLLERCPGCSERAGLDRVDGCIAPAFPGLVPKPGTCNNPRPKARPRATRGPCGHDLRIADPGRELAEWLLSLQRQIINATSSQGRDWWGDLRVLSALALAAIPVEELGAVTRRPLPALFTDAWGRERARLQARVSEARAHVTSNDRPRPTRIRPPTDPRVMAVTTAVALPAMASDEAFAQFVAAARDDITSLPILSRAKGLSARKQLVERLTVLTHSTPRSWLEAPVVLPPPAIRWDPENLPPLLWDDLYSAYLGPTTSGVMLSRRTLRRFAVIALYRLATETTWKRATERFQDKAVRNLNVASAALYSMSKSPGQSPRSGFMAGVNRLAMTLNSESRLPAYPAVRAAATELCRTPIPASTYIRALPKKSSHVASETRRRYAAVWVWSELCSDDPLNAPGSIVDTRDSAEHERYLEWQRRAPSGLLQHLRAWGSDQLRTPRRTHDPNRR